MTHAMSPQADECLLRFRQVTKTFTQGRRRHGGVVAVRNFDLSLHAGEIVGLVGQSGAGKTTVGRLALGLEHPTSGEVIFEGDPLSERSSRAMRQTRQRMHMIFQDPYQSLHPGMPIGEIVAEPLQIAGMAAGPRVRAVRDALTQVSLTPAEDFLSRYPHQL